MNIQNPDRLGAETDHDIGIVRDEMSRLRGKLFNAVEATGMPRKQETATKALVRTLTYDAQGRIEAMIRGES